jgi:hypothetical protein
MLRISRNPISGVYHSAPQAVSTSNRAVHTPAVRLLNTRTTSHIKLAPAYSALEIYNLQGALLWETRRNRTEEGARAIIPRSVKNAGMVVVRFITARPGSK